MEGQVIYTKLDSGEQLDLGPLIYSPLWGTPEDVDREFDRAIKFITGLVANSLSNEDEFVTLRPKEFSETLYLLDRLKEGMQTLRKKVK